MAGDKLTDLPTASSLTDTDLFETSQNISSTPVSRAGNWSQLYSYVVAKAASSWTSSNIITDKVVLDVAREDTSIRRGASSGAVLIDSNGGTTSGSLTTIGQIVTDAAYSTLFSGSDTLPRYTVTYQGMIKFSSGSATYDVAISRISSNTLKISDPNNISNANLVMTGVLGVGTSSPDASAIVDLTSTTKGFAQPRMTSTQRLAIASPVEGLSVYDLTLHQFMGWNGSAWVILG